jgi:hypothetical protein
MSKSKYAIGDKLERIEKRTASDDYNIVTITSIPDTSSLYKIQYHAGIEGTLNEKMINEEWKLIGRGRNDDKQIEIIW